MNKSPSDHGLDVVRSFTEIPTFDREALDRELTRRALANNNADNAVAGPDEVNPWERQRAEGANKSIDALADQIPEAGIQKDQAQSGATHTALFPEADSSQEQQ